MVRMPQLSLWLRLYQRDLFLPWLLLLPWLLWVRILLFHLWLLWVQMFPLIQLIRLSRLDQRLLFHPLFLLILWDQRLLSLQFFQLLGQS